MKINRPQQPKKRRVANSPELEALIALVNGLPEDAYDTAGMEEQIRLSNPGLDLFAVLTRVADRFQTEVSQMPEHLREHIGPARDPQGPFTGVESQGRYNRLILAREILGFIVTHNLSGIELARGMARATEGASHRRDVRVVTRENLLIVWRRLPLKEVLLGMSRGPQSPQQERWIALRWDINMNGELKLISIPGLREIEQSDCLRIRMCPRCSKIFFAGRMHQSSCPEPCAHILRTLRWREAYQAKYKAQTYKKAEAQEQGGKRSEKGRK